MKPKGNAQRTIRCKEKYHENESVECYCQECKVCICLKCGQTRHDHHIKIDVQQAAEERKAQMVKLLAKVKAKTVDVEEKMNEQTELMKKNDEEIYNAYKDMAAFVEEQIRLLNEHKMAMKKKLAEIREEEQTKQATKMKSFEMFASQLRKSVEYGENFLKQSTNFEILQTESTAVSNHCEELLNAKEMATYTPRYVTYRVYEETKFVPGEVLAVHIDSLRWTAEGESLKETELDAKSDYTRGSEGKRFQGEEHFVNFKVRPPKGENLARKRDDPKHVKPATRCKPECFKIHNLPDANKKMQTGKPHRYKSVRSFESRGRGLCSPWSISVSKITGNIALADYYNHRVQLLDSEWNFLGTTGDGGAGDERIDNPTSVAFTASGDVIVVHGELGRRNKLSVFTEDGYFITHISEHVINPCTVSVACDGDQLIVSDKGDKAVKVLSPDGTRLIQTICDGDRDELPWFAIYGRELFFVSFSSANCIKVFGKDGQLLYEIGCKGSGEAQMNHPTGLAIDSFKNLVVCDKGNGRLQIFTLEGEFLNAVKNGMVCPHSVAVTSNGELVVCDTNINAKSYIHVFH